MRAIFTVPPQLMGITEDQYTICNCTRERAVLDEALEKI